MVAAMIGLLTSGNTVEECLNSITEWDSAILIWCWTIAVLAGFRVDNFTWTVQKAALEPRKILWLKHIHRRKRNGKPLVVIRRDQRKTSPFGTGAPLGFTGNNTIVDVCKWTKKILSFRPDSRFPLLRNPHTKCQALNLVLCITHAI